MPTQVQFRRGTTAQNNSFTGAIGEISVNTSNNTLRVHDGTTQGGFELNKRGNVSLLTTGTSAELAAVISDETGTGVLVFSASPTFTGMPQTPTAAANTSNTMIASTAFVTTAVTNLIDSAPEALNTLNELAAAFGNDNNFSATVITQLGNKANTASLTTANVTEVTNLYFTNARSRVAISVGSGGSYDSSTGIITLSSGFVASTVSIFPGHSGNEDYGDLTTSTVDAFGVATGTVYDCMEPLGSLVSEDLVVL